MFKPCLIKTAVLSVLALIFIYISGFSLQVPAAPEARVNDYANMLSQDAKDNIENYLADFEGRTGDQIVIATFPSLEQESLEDFSIRLAEKWKIGQKGKDNGIILVIFKQERKMRIEVGYGLEGDLPDAEASYIIRNVIAPYFKSGDYDGGITAGVSSIVKKLTGGENAVSRESSGQDQGFYTLNREKIIKIVMIIAGLFVLLFLIDLIRYGSYASNRKNYAHRYSFFEWLIIFSIALAILKLIFYMFLMRGGRGGFSGGGSGWGGGGGFSGGGGGSFGGGGSSGGW